MSANLEHDHSMHPHCCESACAHSPEAAVTRRNFLAGSGIALSAAALTGLAWRTLAAEVSSILPQAAPRKALVIKPVLSHDLPTRRPQTSWRSWGGVHTDEAAKEETARIKGELEKLAASADFPVTVLPVSCIRTLKEFQAIEDVGQADVIIHYAAGGPQTILDAVAKSGKHAIYFLRHRSGPVYLWYEIISPRYLHQHKDDLGVKEVDNNDVVVDNYEEITWRLRALCGLKNALGTRIIAIGGPGGWATPKAPEIAKAHWNLDIQTVSYPELKPILEAALADPAAMKLAAARAEDYLKDPKVTLETEKTYVINAFLLEQVFRSLMAKADCSAITINNCMGAIMPISKTTACLTLSLLNDAGYLAFCESDFVVIPAGILLAHISGKPHFINDPTYPHDGVITLAHCTAPRKLDGKTLEPTRLVTHFESDYGAAPKVEMRKGQKVTNIIADFASVRYVGLAGEIVDAPFLPICRSQIDVAYKAPDLVVAQNMPGFHWETCYGDYLKEMGYALKKIGIGWQVLV